MRGAASTGAVLGLTMATLLALTKVDACSPDDDDDTPTPTPIPTPTPTPTPEPTPTPVPTPTPEPPPVDFTLPPPVVDPSGTYDLQLSSGPDCTRSTPSLELMFHTRSKVLVDSNDNVGTYQLKDVDVNGDGEFDGQVGVIVMSDSGDSTYAAGSYWADYPGTSRAGFSGVWSQQETVLCANTYFESTTASMQRVSPQAGTVVVRDTSVLVSANPTSSGGTELVAEARVLVVDGTTGRAIHGAAVTLQWVGTILQTQTAATENGIAVFTLPPSIIGSILGTEVSYLAMVTDVAATGLSLDTTVSELSAGVTALILPRTWSLGLRGESLELATLRPALDPNTLYVVGQGGGRVEDVDAELYGGTNLVDGATVSGRWAGSRSGVAGSVSATFASTTLDNGAVTLSPAIPVSRSDVAKGPVTVTFTYSIDNVAKSGWTGVSNVGVSRTASITVNASDFE